MTMQAIEVELPEGWKAKEYRMPNKGDYFWYQNRVCVASSSFIDQRIIIEKTQPRTIVLDQIPMSEARLGDFMRHPDDTRTIINVGSERHDETYTFWREVQETDIHLTNAEANVKMGVSQGDGLEPKLELSVKECKEAMRKLETFNVTDLSVKICRFLKDK